MAPSMSYIINYTGFIEFLRKRAIGKNAYIFYFKYRIISINTKLNNPLTNEHIALYLIFLNDNTTL